MAALAAVRAARKLHAVPVERAARRLEYAFVVASLALWEIASRVLPPYLVPGPVEVGAQMVQLLTSRTLALSAAASVLHVVVAVACSFVAGAALAFLAHRWPTFRLLVHGRLSPFLNSFSGIGWSLLAVLWFGVGDLTVMFAVTVILLPFSLINLREGFAALDHELLELGRSFSRSTLRIATLVIAPLLLPFAVATLRISFGVAWKVTLTAELLAGDRGLGYLVNIAMQEQDTARILAVALTIVAFVRSVDHFAFEPVQRWLSAAYRRA